jgi:hypothetical protein
MKTENNRQYYCDEGKVFRRKADGFIMGNGYFRQYNNIFQ